MKLPHVKLPPYMRYDDRQTISTLQSLAKHGNHHDILGHHKLPVSSTTKRLPSIAQLIVKSSQQFLFSKYSKPAFPPLPIPWHPRLQHNNDVLGPPKKVTQVYRLDQTCFLPNYSSLLELPSRWTIETAVWRIMLKYRVFRDFNSPSQYISYDFKVMRETLLSTLW